jgi:hypothetical protein
MSDGQDIYIKDPKSEISLRTVEESRENHRGRFATILIAVYLAIGSYIVFGAMLWVTPPGGLDAAVTVLSLVGPIVGTVVGFYFGESRKP